MVRELLAAGMLMVCLAQATSAQPLTSAPHHGVQQLPIGHEAYTFLRHLSVRGLIEGYSEVQLPISEFEASEFLRKVDTTKLSSVERELRLKYLQQTSRDPYPAVTLFGGDSTRPLLSSALFSDDEKYLYRWRNEASLSDFYANALVSLEMRRRDEFDPATVVLGVIGGRLFGTLSGRLGYFLEATNGQAFGDSSVALEDPLIRRNKNFIAYSRNNFDFTTAELAYNYDWFTGKLAREAVALGGSYQGDNVILSPNVPVYDFLSLQGKVGAVRYQAIVASLLGDYKFSFGYDSTNIQWGVNQRIDNKYLTAHNLSVFIGDDVEFGFTDIVVFSRRFDLAYLNPFSFLKSVEHALNDRDNGLLGAHLRARVLPGVEIRGQVLMDDVAASLIGTGYWSNKFAWQAGLMWAAPLGLNELDLTLEWTRVEPYMYSHFGPQNAYVSTQTILGSQIGPNAISWWGRAHWTITRDLIADIDLQLVQRGENIYDSVGKLVFNAGSDVEQSIRSEEERARPTYILDGQRVNVLTVSAYLQYEPWRGFQIFARGTKKQADYLNGIPLNPREQSKSMLSIGARALF